MRRASTPHAIAVLLVFAAAGPARAQVYLPPPPSTLIDTSIRAAAMGGAGAAVMWGEPGVWANPATLAHVSGVGWLTGHTSGAGWAFPIANFRRDPAGEFAFDSQRLLVGAGGVGFSLMGQPISGLG